MKISVIIPTYTPKEYLWECLDSLNNQTFPKRDFEIILVLNGCNEPYKSQIQEYVDSHKELNIKFLHTLQSGVSNARNKALDIARGEYVAFIDDDDLVSPTYLERMYNIADTDTIVLCYPYAFDDGHLDKQLPYSITNVYETCSIKKYNKISSKVRSFFSGPCMKLIPMGFIKDRRFDVRFKNGEDTLFMFLISDCIKNIQFASRDAIYYRRNREGSAVNVKLKLSNVCHSNVLQIVTYIKYYLQNPYEYNILFFFSRIGGALYAIMVRLIKWENGCFGRMH